MHIKKIVVAVVGLVLAGGALAGCSGGQDTAKFCELSKDDKKFEDLEVENPEDMQTAIKKAKDLQAAAPKSVKEDLDLMVSVLEDMSKIDMKDEKAVEKLMEEKVDYEKVAKAAEHLNEETEKLCK